MKETPEYNSEEEQDKQKENKVGRKLSGKAAIALSALAMSGSAILEGCRSLDTKRGEIRKEATAKVEEDNDLTSEEKEYLNKIYQDIYDANFLNSPGEKIVSNADSSTLYEICYRFIKADHRSEDFQDGLLDVKEKTSKLRRIAYAEKVYVIIKDMDEYKELTQPIRERYANQDKLNQNKIFDEQELNIRLGIVEDVLNSRIDEDSRAAIVQMVRFSNDSLSSILDEGYRYEGYDNRKQEENRKKEEDGQTSLNTDSEGNMNIQLSDGTKYKTDFHV